MDLKSIITVLDAEIDALGKARAVLTGAEGLKKTGRRKKRHLSPEGRARIAAAARKRWATQKKSKA
jgi:hypothetical protein